MRPASSPADFGAISIESIAQADAEIAALASSFRSWALEDVERAILLLEQVRLSPRNAGMQLRGVFDALHNIKGQAGTFGYGFVTQVGHIACNVLRGQNSVSSDEIKVLSTCCSVITRALRHDTKGHGGAREAEIMSGLRTVAKEIARRRGANASAE